MNGLVDMVARIAMHSMTIVVQREEKAAESREARVRDPERVDF